MLQMVLALLAAQAAPDARPSPRIAAERPAVPQPSGSFVHREAVRCAALLQRIAPAAGSGSMLYSPEGAERVRLYYLLDRRIDGCAVPVVAVDHAPEADRALGRNLARREPAGR